MNFTRTALMACGAFALWVAPLTTTRSEDWAQFRGPNGSGVSTSSRKLPVEFSSTEKVRWSHDLGDSIASPIVADGRVFTVGMSGEESFAVHAFLASSGSQLWKSEVSTGKLPRITPPNSHASSTPAADDKHVYAYFSTIGLMAFDVTSGKEAWRCPLPKPAYLMDWGAAASPIVVGDLVIFNQDDDLNPYLIAVDKYSGQVKWKSPRSEMLAGYAVPVVCTANGRTDLVIAGSGLLKGYDPKTGQELWHCRSLLRTIMTSPVVKDDLIYVSVQSYGDEKRTLKFALLEWLDANQDGKLARDEVPREFHERFDASDKNHDKIIDATEIDFAFQSPVNQSAGGNTIQAVRGGGKGDVTKTHVVWNINNRSPSNLCSPLVVNDNVYVVKKGGLSSCFNASTGKSNWELKRIGNLGEYYASPVTGDGKVYITGDNGFVVVVESSTELKVLARNDLGGTCLASPAIADGKLYFRTREKLLCIGD